MTGSNITELVRVGVQSGVDEADGAQTLDLSLGVDKCDYKTEYE